MKNSPMLAKYMAKNKVPPAPQWEPVDQEGHGDISTNDFETEDTEADPLDEGDESGTDEPESKKAMSSLDKYQKLKAK
jgi:hypothetical protein